MFVSLMVVSAGAAESLYGNAAAKADSSLSVENMLLYAAQDEYLARGEYAAVMGKFGTIRPFSNIIKAEEQHLSLLKSAFSTYKLSFPIDGSARYLQIPTTLAGAYKAGVQAEVDNIAMYDKFLADPRIQGAQYADLRTLFTSLRNASSNHLRAFQKQVSRY
jgi:hypothetical protein